MQRIVKLWSLVPLVGLSAFWTNPAMVARSKPKMASPTVTTTYKIRPMAPGEVPAGPVRPDVQATLALLGGKGASITLLGFDATVENRQVTVSQGVYIIEQLADASYVWHLQVQRIGGKPQHRYYLDQVFNVPTTTLEPTFKETLRLEPGKYLVRVRLHRLNPGLQVNETNLKGLQGGVRGYKIVTVPQ
jgi:hypothetical protein